MCFEVLIVHFPAVDEHGPGAKLLAQTFVWQTGRGLGRNNAGGRLEGSGCQHLVEVE